MPAIISFEKYEGKNATEIFREPFVKAPELAEQGIKVLNDIQSKLYLYYVSKYGKITKKKNACATPTATGNGVDVTRKPIDVTEMEVYLPQCYDVFLQTIMEGALKKGVDINDLSDTDMDKLIAELIVEGSQRNYFVQIWFADSSLVGDDFYGVYDGFIVRIRAGVASNDIVNTPITAMANPTDAYNTLLAVVNNQSPEMKAVPTNLKPINVTRNIYDLYVTYLSTLNGSEAAYLNVVNGIDRPRILGHEIYVRDLWDTTIASDFPSDFPNGMVVMNVKDESLIVGLDTVGEDTVIDSWYSKEQRKQIYEVQYKVGTEIKFEQYLSVAGFEVGS